MDSKELIRKMLDTVQESYQEETKTPLTETQISINLDGDEAESFLSRLMQLSGHSDEEPAVAVPVSVEPGPAHDMDDAPAMGMPEPEVATVDEPLIGSEDSRYVCDECGMYEDECTCHETVMTTPMAVANENADHDHGHEDIEDEGEMVDINVYTYQPTQVPQRMVKGVMGDNPMMTSESMQRYRDLVNEYVNFITESDQENADGMASPLTAADRQEFDKDPFAGDEAKDDGSMSPMSQIKRQDVMK